jgi:glycosyltransferase involved in cell wall biosynthesis
MGTFEEPLGGTELMFHELNRRLAGIGQDFWDQISLFNYLPQADFTKKTVYWNQLSWDQPAVQFLKDRQIVEKIDHFVFVSHWQAEQFRRVFQIPGYKTWVLKNACLGVEPQIDSPKERIKLCYTSTPWRGLEVLIRAWEILNPSNCELHIFSSCQIYGPEFGQNDSIYQSLYDKCQTTSGIVYRGSIPNEDLRRELTSFDILAYPCTFEETSCISVIDALSAGLRVVSSNLGALPETSEGWARLYPYLMDPETHAQRFSFVLNEEIHRLRAREWNAQDQVSHFQKYWSWDYRIQEWIQFLTRIL